LKKLFALVTFGLMLVMNFWYCYLVVKGEIHPTLMTWIIFSIAVSLSFGTYWASENHNLISGVCNTTDTVLVLIVTFIIVFFGKNVRFEINTFEIICIILALIILVFWRITKEHEKSNLFLQGVMVIAYLPTFYQLWGASVTSESLKTWGINWLISLLGIITAVLGKDKLAIIYSTRALIMITILIFLILRI
jgi:hypothetical protein